MIDVDELRRVMDEKGITNEYLSKELSMNPSTLYRKLKKKGASFNIQEAQIIKRVLKLSSRQAIKIFFDN